MGLGTGAGEGETARAGLANLVLAGFPKTGTTSLFTTLAAHPAIGASTVKETEHFLPARYGEALPPLADYRALFAAVADRPVRMEATPDYVYGGAAVADAMRAALGPVRVVFTVREPRARLRSYFTAQQARLRIPIEMTFDEYVARAADVTDDAVHERDMYPWLGVVGGCYADFLGPWLDAFGDGVRIIDFADLVDDTPGVLQALATWLGIDPAPFARAELAHENPTVLYRRRGLQRFALGFNRRLEPMLRRHPAVKQRIRAAYYAVNGRAAAKSATVLPDAVEARFARADTELAALLRDTGAGPMPRWLVDA